MSNKTWYWIWGGMDILCAALGFIPGPQGALYWLLFGVSVGFFLPPAAILYGAVKKEDRKTVKTIQTLCLIWFAVMLVMLIVNLASISASAAAGTAVYYLLIVLSSPMICSQIWVVPMFGFGCLLTVCRQYLRKKQ